MSTRKIAGPFTVMTPSSAGTNKEVKLSPTHAGLRAGQLQYTVKVLDRENAVVEIGLRVDHSVDGTTTATHSTAIATATFGTPPLVLVGDATIATIALPHLHPVLILDISSGSAERWVSLEVYETWKEL